jgi:hypothetical protein
MPKPSRGASPRARFVKAPEKRVAAVPVIVKEIDEKIAQRVLPENKRKVLEDLLTREQIRAKREKLTNILVQKLVVKYGRCVPPNKSIPPQYKPALLSAFT